MTSIRRTLARLGSALLLAAIVLAVPLGITGFVIVGLDGWRAHHGGISGTLGVSTCDWHQRRGGGGWVCNGQFVSDDLNVQVLSIGLVEEDRNLAGQQVRVLISDSGATEAWALSDKTWWREPFEVLSLTMVGLIGIAIQSDKITSFLSIVRRVGQKPPVPAVTDQPRKPMGDLGNRARRRRRKRRNRPRSTDRYASTEADV